MNEQDKTNEITIGFFWAVLRRRLIPLILALLIGGAGAFLYTHFLVAPVYSSACEFKVENTYESPSMMNSGYQLGATQLAASYASEIKGNVFLGEITTKYNALHAKSLTIQQMARKITVSSESELPFFHIQVSSTDPQEAYDILAVIQELAPGLLLTESTKTYIDIKATDFGVLATSPDSPNKVLNTIIGAAAVFLIAYVVFFLIAFLDKTVYDEESLKANCKVPVVAQIPQWVRRTEIGKNGKKQYEAMGTAVRAGHIERDYAQRLLNKSTPFSVSESFKTLRTNLTYVAIEDEKNPVFAVTSGFAGEGKSLLVANIAISFGQLGKKILLIDGDMRCPVQHKVFAIDSAKHGLSEALAGIDKNPLEDCVVSVDFQGVDVMPCGHIPPNPSELLSSARMKTLLAAAKEKYDYIFLDLPPVLETADAGVVAPLVSGYVIVARAGYSKIDAIVSSVEMMEATHANLVGIILNDVSGKTSIGYYSYGRYAKYSKYTRYAARYEEVNAAKSEEQDTPDASKTEAGKE